MPNRNSLMAHPVSYPSEVSDFRQPRGPFSQAVRRYVLLLVAAATTGSTPTCFAAPTQVHHLLFDFEKGVSKWVGNPWGGGESGAAAGADAAYGENCLRAWFRDVERGATVIAPEFPKDASWRNVQWTGISMFVRGDGSPDSFQLHIATLAPESLNWSRTLPLENRNWHRVYLPFRTFWNRRRKRLDPARIQRIYFGGRGTHEVWIDQIQFETTRKTVPLENEQVASAIDAAVPVCLDLGNGMYAARFDTTSMERKETALTLEIRLRTGQQNLAAMDRASPAEVRHRELLAILTERVRNEGPATVELMVRTATGKAIVRRAGRFQVFLPMDRPEKFALPILPTPKRIMPATGHFHLTANSTLFTVGHAERLGRVTGFLTTELKREYGIDLTRAKSRDMAAIRLFLFGNDTNERVPERLTVLLRNVPRDRITEGYALVLTPTGVDVAAATAHGLYNGLQSLLQLLRADTTGADAVRARCLTVTDWPSLEWRALTMTLPTDRWGHPNNAPVSGAFYRDFIRRFVARHKFNAIALGINAGYRFASHPEIAGPAAWNRRNLDRFVQTCRDNFIEPIPFVNSYGHTGWLTLRHPELREDGDLNTLCVSNPKSFRILTDLYAELLDIFGPVRFFHIGMDEIRWKTLRVPPEKRCRLCAGKPKYELVASHIRRLHDWLGERGVRTMIWGDMLLPEHNGDAPFHSARALPLLPRDIVIANWSTSLAPDSNARFRRLGFTVWQSNSRGVNREQARWCTGNMFGSWTKMPWWADAPWRSGQAFNFLSFPIAAQYSWNLWPDVDSLQPGLDEARLTRMLPGWVHDSVDPVPAASGRTFTLDVRGNFSSRASTPPDPSHWFGADSARDLRNLPGGTVRILGMPFHVQDGIVDCVRPSLEGSETSLPVNRRVAELRFLHTAFVPPDRQKKLDESFKSAENWPGIRIGRYRIEYADGEHADLPIRYIANIKRWDVGGKLPFVFHSAGYLRTTARTVPKDTAGAKDICLYVAQWVNPHPEKTVTRVLFSAPPDAPAIPVLFAVSGADPMKR